MTTRALLPLFITALLAVLLVVGFNVNGRSTSASHLVRCPTEAPGTPTETNTPGGPAKTPSPTGTPCFLLVTPSTPPPTPPLRSSGDAKLTVHNASVSPGESVTVTLDVVVGPPGIGEYTIDVIYPAGLLTATACSNGPPNTQKITHICNRAYASNQVRFVGADPVGFHGALSLGSITFRAAGYNCGATLHLQVARLVGPNSGDLSGKTNNGLVTIQGGPGLAVGDVNCDGATGAVDAGLIFQVTAGLLSELPFPEHGDVSRDDRTDAVDAALILQLTAGLLGSLPP